MGKRSAPRREGRPVIIRIDPALHKRLKHVATDLDATLMALVRQWIAEGVVRAERELRRPTRRAARPGDEVVATGA